MNKETKDLVILAAKIGNGIAAAIKDGKFGVDDIAAFGPAAVAFPAAMAGISDVGAEIASFNDADREDLANEFCIQFAIEQQAAELMVEKAIQIIVAVWNFIK